MRKLILLCIAAFAIFTSESIFGQTVYQNMTARTSRLTSSADCADAAGSRWTGWVNVSTYRNVVFDIVFTDANSSAASLDVRCETSSSSGTTADAGSDLPAIVSTASTGTSTVVPAHTWSYVSTSGGAPGSFSTTLYIENIPQPFIECLFTCGAGGAAADTIVVGSRTITP